MLTMFANLAGVKPEDLQTLLIAVRTFVTEVPEALERVEQNSQQILRDNTEILDRLGKLLGEDASVRSNDHRATDTDYPDGAH